MYAYMRVRMCAYAWVYLKLVTRRAAKKTMWERIGTHLFDARVSEYWTLLQNVWLKNQKKSVQRRKLKSVGKGKICVVLCKYILIAWWAYKNKNGELGTMK